MNKLAIIGAFLGSVKNRRVDIDKIATFLREERNSAEVFAYLSSFLVENQTHRNLQPLTCNHSEKLH